MTAVKVAIDAVGITASVAMVANCVRWYLRGWATWYELRAGLDEIGEDPTWKPVQPALGQGVYLLVHPPTVEGMSELERVDVAGRTAIARSWLWFGGGIAALAVVILAQHI
jgi:hypothetical protein